MTTPWTVAHRAPLSVGFPRQEYWSGLPFPSPGDLPDPGSEPVSPAWQVDFFTLESPGKPISLIPPVHPQYNTEFVWSLSLVPGRELQKPLEFPEQQECPCYANEGNSAALQIASGKGPVPRKTDHMTGLFHAFRFKRETLLTHVQFSSVQSLSCVQLFATP